MIRRINRTELTNALGNSFRQVAAIVRRFAGVRRDNSFFVSLEQAQVTANLSPAEAETLAREAVRAVRSDYLR